MGRSGRFARGTITANKKHVFRYLVRVGEIDYLYSSKYNSSPADYLIKRAIKHEEYANQENDIGLLITQEHIQFNGEETSYA